MRAARCSRRPRGDGGPAGRRGEANRDSPEEEAERWRKENALLKRSCRDPMNGYNELSNRLFDVNESLKKVARAFLDEEEMESLEWFLWR